MLEDPACDLRAPDIQVFQIHPVFEKRHTAVRNIRAREAIQIDHVLERPEVRQAKIANSGVGEIDLPQIGKRADPGQILVRDPSS
jgi:hypothetical protein